MSEAGGTEAHTSTNSSRDARRALRDDRAFEARVLWKGLLALLVVIIVIWLRQTYWL